MKTKIIGILIILALLVTNNVCSQVNSTFDDFINDSREITTFTVYEDSELKLGRAWIAKTNIIEVRKENKVEYFYEISKRDRNKMNLAIISEKDISILINSIKSMKIKFKVSNIKSDIIYKETKYTTGDGFIIGYYTYWDRSEWFLVLNNNKYKSKNYYIKNIDSLLRALTSTKSKIRAYKLRYGA